VPEGSSSTIVVWAVAAVLATVAVVRMLGDDAPPPAPISVSDGPGAHASGGGSGKRGSGSGASEGRIYVHVAGAVRRPRLMTLPPGSRVADALGRAGGPTPRADLTAINLAARLTDGQQVVVPTAGRAGAPAAPAGASAAQSGAPAGQVHLSTATVDQLDGIDGIGPTLAERIIEYRDSHGGFSSLDELAQVDGIGEKRLATLREALQP
jgi:competence protein ComEA